MSTDHARPKDDGELEASEPFLPSDEQSEVESPKVSAEVGRESDVDDAMQRLIGDERVEVTEEDNERIRWKTDKHILTLLIWVYFLQILDKSVLGYGAIWGLRDDAHLTGDQYSLVGSVAAIVQLAWQPFSSWLIVRVRPRILMPALVLGWGVAQAGMAACTSYGSLMATRALLGLFEAGCLPLFSVLTSQWYRRAEQPMRVALWYGTNGLATMVASALSYGLGRATILSGKIHSWQLLFAVVGAITVLSSPVVYWRLDDDVSSARFLTPREKLQAVERLRANNTGIGAEDGDGKHHKREFKMRHVWEALLEPKTWLFVGIMLCINVTAAVTNTFGPIVVQGLGFDSYSASLLSIPFGAVQLLVIIPASWAAHRLLNKSGILAVAMIPVLIGAVLLRTIPRQPPGGPLAAYYLLAFTFAGNPLMVSWVISNTGGATKKSVVLSLLNAGSSTGNIIGPLLFSSDDAPYYYPGLAKVMAISCVLVAAIGVQVVNLVVLNRVQERRRVANGKPAKIRDMSMQYHYRTHDAEVDHGNQDEQRLHIGNGEASAARLGQNAFRDMTDQENDEFVHVY